MFSLKSDDAFAKPIHKIEFLKYSLISLATFNNNKETVSSVFQETDA